LFFSFSFLFAQLSIHPCEWSCSFFFDALGTRCAKQLIENIEWCKQWAEKVGLGFKLPSLPLEIGQPSQSKTQPAKAA